ncbi:ferrochelatase [Histophilus somni]|uniref:ferrochelatase n=1 Tax=Histophilus somni TaxID=731 RepID=UPI00201EDF30|nr:ferrochelatase [Histophilus somni]
MKKIGIILANLGTPDEPTPKALSRYLWQFLTDPRVVDLPKWRWYPLLKSIILPRRSARVAKIYQTVWTDKGSPLLVISNQQKQTLQSHFDEHRINATVEIAMTYGNPSMESAVEKLLKKHVNEIILLPLFPQYSSTTTGAVFDAFAQALKKQRNIVPFQFIHSYHLHEDYIEALVNSINAKHKPDEYLIFSFHGIPLRYENEGDYYRKHCHETVLAVVERLGLRENQWQMTFQSRFGKEEWLQPYTDKVLENIYQRNIQKVAVVCPGFSADCLETIEEINEENRRIFLSHGGASFQYIPALNAEMQHIEMMYKLISSRL